MRVIFHYPRKIDKTTYVKGIQTVSDELLKHFYFKALVKKGDVVVVETPSVVDTDTADEQTIFPSKKKPGPKPKAKGFQESEKEEDILSSEEA